MSDIRLSICIATWRRADIIGETLAAIIPQMTVDTELVVVDGASPDATGKVVTAAFVGHGNCRYIRLPEKGGVDNDYHRAVKEARGGYCWLMTDDDVIKHGAVARVLSALKGDPDLVVVNAEVAGPDLTQTLLERKLDIDADWVIDAGRHGELLSLTGDLLTFIGAVVIRRETWLARDHTPYIGTEFAHVGMIFQAPFKRSVRVLAEPLVRIRYGVGQWSARAFDIWMFNWPMLVWSLPQNDAAKEAVTPREPWRKPGRLVTAKAQGNYALEQYRTRLRDRDMPPHTRLIAWLIASLPAAAFQPLMKLIIPLLPARERAMMRFELDRARRA